MGAGDGGEEEEEEGGRGERGDVWAGKRERERGEREEKKREICQGEGPVEEEEERRQKNEEMESRREGAARRRKKGSRDTVYTHIDPARTPVTSCQLPDEIPCKVSLCGL